MASRRTRLKAVINLPIRRAREGDQSSTSVGDKQATESPQTTTPLPTDTELPKEATEVIVSSKQNEIPKTSVCRPANKPTSIDTNENVRATEEENRPNVKLKSESEHAIPEQTSGQNISGHSKIDVVLPPPKLTIPVRKRLKPVVSLSALTRKPKDIGLEIEKTAKDVDAKNVKENRPTSTLHEKPSEHIVDIQKTSSIENVGSVDNTQKDDASRLLPPPKNTDNVKLLSPTKVLSKPKFPKLTPRLIDSSARRQSHQPEIEDSLKVLPSVGQRVDVTVTRSTHTPSDARQTIPDADDELETSSLYSCSTTHVTQPSSNKITTAPSVTSTVHEDPLELDDGQPAKVERRPQTHRRPRKSGVGEILSVARRDFYKKFGSNTPDKKQLTMFDLIFYNPTSNPMKNTSKEKCGDKLASGVTTEPKPADVITERIAEESVDDVTAPEEEEMSAIPAPQVKVGPDGSLIIDEKSLVIATTGSQKRKEELANSSVVVDYGLGNATYNSFSKKVKPKDWSKQETLKFYRALQAVGTDFLLMKSIFPTRTRGDLKQKYKKEDRLNRDLIDKALRNPLEFDLTALEQELEQEGKENQEKEKRRLEELEKKEIEKKLLLRKKGGVSGAIASALLDDLPVNKPKETNPNKRKRDVKLNGNKPTKKPSKRKKIVSESSSSDEEVINLKVNFDNTCEVIEEGEENVACEDDDDDNDREDSYLRKSPQPTRYGRVPRSRSASRDATRVPTPENNDQPAFNIASLDNVEPGSLVILSTPGQKSLQLFMVAPKSQNSSLTHIPVAITPEILASVNNGISHETSTAAIDYTETNKNSVNISLDIDT